MLEIRPYYLILKMKSISNCVKKTTKNSYINNYNKYYYIFISNKDNRYNLDIFQC